MNYPYTSIQLIDGEIKAVCNKEVEPKITEPSKIYTLIFYFTYNLWQQKHEIFEFANPHEEGKIMRHIGGMNPKIKYAIEVTCIEIKDGKSWFKEENTNEDEQHKLWCEVVEIFVDTMLGEKMYPLLLEQFKIIRK